MVPIDIIINMSMIIHLMRSILLEAAS